VLRSIQEAVVGERGRPKDPELLAKADAFLAKYAMQEKKNVKEAAVAIRPELRPESAAKWGKRVLEDPDARKKLRAIEQGAIAKIYDLVDDAIYTLAQFVRDESTPKSIRIKALELVLRRVLGGIPETVILQHFSIFDGDDAKRNIRDVIKEQMRQATYERRIDSPPVRSGESKALAPPSVEEESTSPVRG